MPRVKIWQEWDACVLVNIHETRILVVYSIINMCNTNMMAYKNKQLCSFWCCLLYSHVTFPALLTTASAGSGLLITNFTVSKLGRVVSKLRFRWKLVLFFWTMEKVLPSLVLDWGRVSTSFATFEKSVTFQTAISSVCCQTTSVR